MKFSEAKAVLQKMKETTEKDTEAQALHFALAWLDKCSNRPSLELVNNLRETFLNQIGHASHPLLTDDGEGWYFVIGEQMNWGPLRITITKNHLDKYPF